MKFSLNSPIRKNIIANLFGVGINLINQIVLVPFYIIYWGNDLYADWIVLTALTAFFSMSDIGLNTVIQNRFSIKLAKNDIKECNALLTNNIIIITSLLIIILVGALFYIHFFDIKKQMNINVLSKGEVDFIFIVLIINVFVKMYSGVENAIYRATHHASRAVYFDQFALLSTVVITFIILIFHIPLWILSLLICIPNFILILIKYYDSQQYYIYRFKIKDINLSLLKRLILPSLSFMSFPLGNAIVLQGYTLLVNKCFGADNVVLYNTTRTMCNFIKTLLGTIQNSIWPEYSISYGKEDFSRMRFLHRKAIKVSILGSILISLFLLLLGPFIYDYWTQHKVTFQYELMAAYLLIIIIENLWLASSITLMATNNHSILGILFVSTAASSLFLACIVTQHSGELYQVVLTMLFMHFILSIYTIRKGLQFTHDTFTLRKWRFPNSK